MRKALALSALLLAAEARADAAFPTGMTLLVPANVPRRILLGATFGLVITDDAAASWRYVCEPYVTGSVNNVLVYQAGSDGSLLAAHLDNLSRSSDLGCTWTRATGAMAGQSVLDAFIDPNDSTSVLAIAWPSGPGSALYPSHDGGRTFAAPVLPSTEMLVSVEVAATRGVAYAASFAFASAADPGGVALWRTQDSGTSWARFPVKAMPAAELRIALVDPQDARTVYLQITEGNADTLARTTDGGATVERILSPGAKIGGFARAADGTIYTGTTAGDFYVRSPGATSFQRFAGPRLRCLAERAGVLYACGDPLSGDNYDLGVSNDGGRSFRPLLRFAQLLGPASCAPVQSACAADWARLQRALAASVRRSGGCQSGQASGHAAALLILVALRTRRRRPARGPR